MSNNTGAVRFPDKEIWYFEYEGVSDTVSSHIYPTTEEVSANWRKHQWMECTCAEEEPVSIYIGYGDYAIGLACRRCKSVATHSTDEYGSFTSEENSAGWAKEIFDY